MRPDHEYPAAAQLFGAYLHQDWPEESGSWAAAVDLFAAKESGAQRAAAARDLARLLAIPADDAALAATVHALGSYYGPEADDGTYRHWLTLVLARLRAGPFTAG